jgi:hypothetical protein
MHVDPHVDGHGGFQIDSYNASLQNLFKFEIVTSQELHDNDNLTRSKSVSVKPLWPSVNLRPYFVCIMSIFHRSTKVVRNPSVEDEVTKSVAQEDAVLSVQTRGTTSAPGPPSIDSARLATPIKSMEPQNLEDMDKAKVIFSQWKAPSSGSLNPAGIPKASYYIGSTRDSCSSECEPLLPNQVQQKESQGSHRSIGKLQMIYLLLFLVLLGALIGVTYVTFPDMTPRYLGWHEACFLLLSHCTFNVLNSV